VGDWEGRYTVVCMRWMDATKCGAFAELPMGGRRERTYTRYDVGGREVVRGRVQVYSVYSPSPYSS